MSARANRIPKYHLHKASGRAVVTLSGRDYYLGRHGSDRPHGRVVSRRFTLRRLSV